MAHYILPEPAEQVFTPVRILRWSKLRSGGQGEPRVIQKVQFQGALGLVRGGEFPFLEAEIALGEYSHYTLQK